MTGEQIEQEVAVRCGSKNEVLNDFGVASFIDGADWRISSVWHTTADIPATGKRCLVEYKADGQVQHRVDWRSEYEWVEACHYDKILRWAYVDDLLPERQEDRE